MNTREVDKIVEALASRYPQDIYKDRNPARTHGDYYFDSTSLDVKSVVEFVLSQAERRDDGDPE